MKIVSGIYGGRPLKTLEGKTTRPTSDKVRGAIFNMIGPYFEGGRVLDLYAGSGGLSIEAVSRGMSSAVLVERDRKAQTIVAENIQMTKEVGKFQLLKMDAPRNNAPCHPTKETTTGRDPTHQAGRKVCGARPLITVGSTPRGASTPGLWNTGST